MASDDTEDLDAATVIAATQRWLEVAVIGLDLCPFARPVARAGRIRYVVSRASTRKQLRRDLIDALRELAGLSPEAVETTLLVHPWALQDFYAFNDFLAETDAVLEDLGFAGTLQIASFHPHYQFADAEADDISNATNRAPFPTLHLLREASIERAIGSMADPSVIYRRNIATLRALGAEGWLRLQRQFATESAAQPSIGKEPSPRPPRADRTPDSESV